MKLMGNYKKLDDKDIAFIKNVIGDEESSCRRKYQ